MSKVQPGSQVLGHFSNGQPALVRSALGAGVGYYLAFLPGVSHAFAGFASCNASAAGSVTRLLRNMTRAAGTVVQGIIQGILIPMLPGDWVCE